MSAVSDDPPISRKPTGTMRTSATPPPPRRVFRPPLAAGEPHPANLAQPHRHDAHVRHAVGHRHRSCPGQLHSMTLAIIHDKADGLETLRLRHGETGGGIQAT